MVAEIIVSSSKELKAVETTPSVRDAPTSFILKGIESEFHYCDVVPDVFIVSSSKELKAAKIFAE